MEYIDPWLLLQGGKAEQEQGLRLVRASHAQQPNPSHGMQLGIALLWLRKYAEAQEHFLSTIETSSVCGDSDFGKAGVAMWCCGKPGDAVSQWRAGLKAKYARASGLGVRMPLLLFFAAVRQPSSFDRELAGKILQETILDRRIKNWPGPLARLALGQISDTECDQYCRGISPFARYGPQEISNRLWLAALYKSVLPLQQRESSEFHNFMRDLSDTSQPEWRDVNHVFTARIWCEEFFLARYEASPPGPATVPKGQPE